MAPEPARGVLEGHWTYVKEYNPPDAEGETEYLFRGDVFNLPTDSIKVTFCHQKLAASAVTFSTNDPRPVRWRWQQVVTEITREWGVPDQQREPGAAAGSAADPVKMVTLPPSADTDDHDVETQGLGAGWTFAHHVQVIVIGVPGDVDSANHGKLSVAFIAMAPEIAGECRPTPNGAKKE